MYQLAVHVLCIYVNVMYKCKCTDVNVQMYMYICKCLARDPKSKLCDMHMSWPLLASFHTTKCDNNRIDGSNISTVACHCSCSFRTTHLAPQSPRRGQMAAAVDHHAYLIHLFAPILHPQWNHCWWKPPHVSKLRITSPCGPRTYPSLTGLSFVLHGLWRLC